MSMANDAFAGLSALQYLWEFNAEDKINAIACCNRDAPGLAARCLHSNY